MRRRAVLGWLGAGVGAGAGLATLEQRGSGNGPRDGPPAGSGDTADAGLGRPPGAEPTVTRRYPVPKVGGGAHLRVQVPRRLYDHYAALPRHDDYLAYATDRGNARALRSVARQLIEMGAAPPRGTGTLEAAIAFVQGLEYATDASRGVVEYPKYPVETLVEGDGDCEDTAALLAGVLARAGYDVALLVLHGVDHMAVGVAGDRLGLSGTAYARRGRTYYYVETVELGWAIGEVPGNFAGEPAEILPLGH